MASNISVLLSTFPGLSLPKTVSLSIPSTASHNDLRHEISSLLPSSLSLSRLRLTTTCNREVLSSSQPISALVASSSDNAPSFLPLRLSAPLCGGKGGFGSQLRAAGGRMSSKRKGNREEDNGSSRNLDGRRLRTVNEAKALAEYLAMKPGMDKKAKDAKRERLEKVVADAERAEEELRKGKGKAKIDGEWMESKEEAAERAREAVQRAMKEGGWTDSLAGVDVNGASSSGASGGSASPSEEESEAEAGAASDRNAAKPFAAAAAMKATPAPVPKKRKFFGFDDEEDDDEFSSDEDDEEEEVEGKGKRVKA